MKQNQPNDIDTLPELVSPYLKELIAKTGGNDGPIGRQFIAHDKHHEGLGADEKDPLLEDEHEVAPGLVYKYEGKLNSDGSVKTFGRALFTITRFCASYCRFCTRGREVGLPPAKNRSEGPTLMQRPFLTPSDIDKTIDFIKKHKEINEIIISGGDPLTAPRDYLTSIIEKLSALQKNGDLSIIRIGSRLPIANPRMIQPWHYELLAKLKNPYLMVHINHADEVTDEAVSVLTNFRKVALASVLSQTVFLAGVNDDEDTLYKLFYKLTEAGIRPYYVFQCDPVPWAKDFIVPPKKAIAIWKKLRPRLSGIAGTARLVIDVPGGYGKIPVPEGDAWDLDYSAYRDFKGKKFSWE